MSFSKIVDLKEKPEKEFTTVISPETQEISLENHSSEISEGLGWQTSSPRNHRGQLKNVCSKFPSQNCGLAFVMVFLSIVKFLSFRFCCSRC